MPNQQPGCDSRLESLPPEVRRQILATLDLPQLKAMVRASPTFHEQYLFDRNYLLCTSLEKTLDSVTADAYAVYLYTTQGRDLKQNGFLKLYSTNRSWQFLTGRLTYEEALNIVSFYSQLVKPLIEYYSHWILNNLANVIGRDACSRIVLTRMEELRLTRAIYRFHLLCQLADPTDSMVTTTSRGETTQAFLNMLEPWEVEELFSFYQFAQDVYNRILKDIRWDLHPDNPKFNDQRRPPTPEGAFDLDGLSKSSHALKLLPNSTCI